ncbi:MAG: twin-arginine translocase TatA/TatE family subunit [Chloroflexota bacterium]
MPFHLGTPELLILLLIVVILFGAGRIGKIARELGGGIKAFKDGIEGAKDNSTKTNEHKE